MISRDSAPLMSCGFQRILFSLSSVVQSSTVSAPRDAELATEVSSECEQLLTINTIE